jgi:tRNA threonylcarbamoyladenosine biosynthesis protein TsaE
VIPLRARTRSVEETRALGAALAGVVGPGAVLVLCGELGAGKTALAQGIAIGLGVTARVTSPTFTMVATYPTDHERGIESFLHADLYRVGSGVEADDLAIAELVEEAGVAAVEWGDLAPDVLGPRQVVLRITQGEADDDRTIEIQPGPVDPELLEGALERWLVR